MFSPEKIYPVALRRPPRSKLPPKTILREFAGDFVIAYAALDGDRIQYFTTDWLPPMVSPAGLHHLASLNLDRDVIFQPQKLESGAMAVLATAGDAPFSLVSSALSLTRLWVWLATKFEDDIAVAVRDIHHVEIAPAAKRIFKPDLVYSMSGVWSGATE
jgi:hypothetical protein